MEDIRQKFRQKLQQQISVRSSPRNKENPDITTVSNILNSQTNYSQDFYQSRSWVEPIQQPTWSLYQEYTEKRSYT